MPDFLQTKEDDTGENSNILASQYQYEILQFTIRKTKFRKFYPEVRPTSNIGRVSSCIVRLVVVPWGLASGRLMSELSTIQRYDRPLGR